MFFKNSSSWRDFFWQRKTCFPTTITRWWFHFIFFYVHLYLGKIPILTNIVQMGWNHQPDKYQLFPSRFHYGIIPTTNKMHWFQSSEMVYISL